MSAARDEKYNAPFDAKESALHSQISIDLKSDVPLYNLTCCTDSLPDDRLIISEKNDDTTGKLAVWNLTSGECEVIIQANKFINKMKVLSANTLIVSDEAKRVSQVSFSEPSKTSFTTTEMKSLPQLSIPKVDLQYQDGNGCPVVINCGCAWTFKASFDISTNNEQVLLNQVGMIYLEGNYRNAMHRKRPMKFVCYENRKCCSYLSTNLITNFGGYYACCLIAWDLWDNLEHLKDDVMLLTNKQNASLTLVNIREGQFSEDYKLVRPMLASKTQLIATTQLAFFAHAFFNDTSFNIYKVDNLRLEYFGTYQNPLASIYNIKALRSGTGFVLLDEKGIHLYDLETRKIVHSHLDDKVIPNTLHIRKRDGAVIYFSENKKAGIIHYQREIEFFEYKKELQAARAFRLASKKIPEQKKKTITPLVNVICKFVTPDFYGKFFKSRNQLLPEVDHATGTPKKTDAPTMTR